MSGKKKGFFKKPQGIIFSIACVILLGLFVNDLVYQEPIDEDFMHDYTQFDEAERISDSPIVYEVSLEGAPVGYLAFDSHYGYQSDITMASLIDTSGTLLDARIYSHDETPAYIQKLVGGSFYKNNFTDVAIEDGFSIDTNVDAISHATLSSNASTQAVQKSVSYVGENYIDVDVADVSNSMSIGYIDILVAAMLILAFLTQRFAKKNWLKWVTRVYSVVVMGFMVAQFITLSTLVALFSFDWPSAVDYLRWYILIFGVLALIVVTGKNTYCSYICPFGAFQEAEFALAGNLGKKPLNPRVGKILRMFPAILVFISLVCALGFHNLQFANYEPFSLLFGQVGTGVQWVLLPLILVGAIFSRRFYCTFACPVGYVLNKILKVRMRIVKLVRKDKKEKNAPMKNDVATPAPAPAETISEPRKTASTTPEKTREPQKADKPARAKKPLKGYDMLILCLGVALGIVSLLTILSPMYS